MTKYINFYFYFFCWITWIVLICGWCHTRANYEVVWPIIERVEKGEGRTYKAFQICKKTSPLPSLPQRLRLSQIPSWLNILPCELGSHVRRPMSLYCCNNASIRIAHNLVHRDLTKYIKVDKHFVEEKLSSMYTLSQDNRVGQCLKEWRQFIEDKYSFKLGEWCNANQHLVGFYSLS